MYDNGGSKNKKEYEAYACVAQESVVLPPLSLPTIIGKTYTCALVLLCRHYCASKKPLDLRDRKRGRKEEGRGGGREGGKHRRYIGRGVDEAFRARNAESIHKAEEKCMIKGVSERKG